MEARFPPFYMDVTLVDAPLDQAVSDAKKWWNPPEETSVPFCVPPMRPYEYKEPNSFGLFWAPSENSGHTALVDNCSMGYNLALRFGHRVLAMRVSPPEDEWPICELALYEGGALRRFIRAFRDDAKWDFFEEGEPLTFEHTEFYTKRRIKDRFIPSLLHEYCLKLGWDISPHSLFTTSQLAVRLVRPWNQKNGRSPS